MQGTSGAYGQAGKSQQVKVDDLRKVLLYEYMLRPNDIIIITSALS